MDTSITFAFVAAVLFAFVLPAVLRRSARVDEELPLDAEAVESAAARGCAVDRSRPGLLDREHSALVDLPAGPEISAEPPSLRLRRDEPALTVIDGAAPEAAEGADDRAEAAAAEEASVAVLPLASGQSAPIAAAPPAQSPRPVDAVLEHSSDHTPRLPMEPHMNVTPQTEPRRIAAAAERMPQALPADIRARLDRSYQTAPRQSAPARGETASATSSARSAEAPHGPSAAQRRRLRGLRAVLPFCGVGVIGFALLTIGLIIAAAVTSLSWAAPVVTAALTVGALALVRALNREIRALRRGEEPAKPVARTAAPARRAPQSDARTVVTAEDLDDDATGEIPLVRAEETVAEETGAEERAAEPIEPDAVLVADAEADSSAEDAPAEAEAEDAIAEAEEQASRPDPMSARLAAGGWTPKGLPAPRYAEAPVAEREQPEPVVADASSYTLAPTTKEALAEAFAEELGYRPEIADHAAEAGPLRHGRNAIRSTGTEGAAAPEASVSALSDVLARRRA